MPIEWFDSGDNIIVDTLPELMSAANASQFGETKGEETTMLSDEVFREFANRCTPNTETGGLNYKNFGRMVEDEVRKQMTAEANRVDELTELRKQDEALIRQLVEALENSSDLVFKDPSHAHARGFALAVGRAHLVGKHQSKVDPKFSRADEAHPLQHEVRHK